MKENFKKEFGRNPNAKELESYFNIQDNPNTINPYEVNQMIEQYKEQNGGKVPNSKELQEFWNKQEAQMEIIPNPEAVDGYVNDYLRIY